MVRLYPWHKLPQFGELASKKWEQIDPGTEDELQLKQPRWCWTDHQRQFEDEYQSWSCCFYMYPPHFVYKSSCSTSCQSGRSQPLDRHLSPSPGPQLPSSEIKQTFVSTNVAFLLAFEWLFLPWSFVSNRTSHTLSVTVLETYYGTVLWVSLRAQLVKNSSAMREIWVWSLGWEDPLEEGMATPSSILAWRIPWTEEPGGLQSMGSQRVGHDWASKYSTAQHCITHCVCGVSRLTLLNLGTNRTYKHALRMELTRM